MAANTEAELKPATKLEAELADFHGKVSIAKALPYGIQHVLAMFVANVTPVMLIASVAVYNGQAFTAIDTALLIQAAMLVAGIGTLVHLFPVWRIGSRLPVVMGLSFTFLSAMMTLAAKDYGYMIGALTDETLDTKKPE